MAESTGNRFGRKPGRGLRPYLLLPKVFSVSLLVGGLACLLVLQIALLNSPEDEFPVKLEQIRLIYHWIVIPSGLATALFGAALLLQHPKILLAQRWLQVKLAMVVVALAVGHLFSLKLLAALDSSSAGGNRTPSDGTTVTLMSVTAGVLAILLIIVILGRHKPRLGQNWAKAYAKQQKRMSDDKAG